MWKILVVTPIQTIKNVQSRLASIGSIYIEDNLSNSEALKSFGSTKSPINFVSVADPSLRSIAG